ncbi:MAG: gamma carbonic anhydrase family protein [Gammaproteobacteria bacterium]
MTIRRFDQHQPVVADSAYVDPGAVVVGDVTLGAYSSVWPMAVIRGDIHRIRIGARTSIQDGSVLHVTHASDYHPEGFALQVGDDVTVGHHVVLHGCTLGDGCLIGMGSLVMDGAVIEAGAMVGAGSLVSPGTRVSGGDLWLGRPARRERPLSGPERDYLRYVAARYVALARRYRGGT